MRVHRDGSIYTGRGKFASMIPDDRSRAKRRRKEREREREREKEAMGVSYACTLHTQVLQRSKDTRLR